MKVTDAPMVELNMCLCEGRYKATDGAIFNTAVFTVVGDDNDKLESYAFWRIWEVARKHDSITQDSFGCDAIDDNVALNLYVNSGDARALVAVLNVCHEVDIPVVLHHYNRQTGKRTTQVVS